MNMYIQTHKTRTNTHTSMYVNIYIHTPVHIYTNLKFAKTYTHTHNHIQPASLRFLVTKMMCMYVREYVRVVCLFVRR